MNEKTAFSAMSAFGPVRVKSLGFPENDALFRCVLLFSYMPTTTLFLAVLYTPLLEHHRNRDLYMLPPRDPAIA
jgi:hypothetical protein